MIPKLEYLNRYNVTRNGYIRLIQNDDIDLIDTLPETWRTIFKEKDMSKRIMHILNIWKGNFASELRNTITYLESHLESIELIEINSRFSILYTIKNQMGDTIYYEGRCPNKSTSNEELKEVWEKIPSTIKKFYENIHDGFYYYASGAMGLLPMDDVAFLGDDDFDWSIIDELDEPLQIDLGTSFGFFSNGMGTYVAVDYNNCSDNNATLWSSKEEPEYNINFWDFVDEWYVLGLEM